MKQDKEFIINCKTKDLLSKEKGSFLYDEFLIVLHFYDDNVSCYLTYCDSNKVDKKGNFQINFCIDNEELYIVDYILIEDKLLNDKDVLFNYMEDALSIFSSNIKSGQYDEYECDSLGGKLFFNKKDEVG